MERLNSIFCFVILYSILILALEESSLSYAVDICSNTIPTLTTVEKCPDTDDKHVERSRNKDCNMLCRGKPCVYHCVKYINRTVEVCAPVEKLTGHHCPTYDEGIGRIRADILAVCTKCPVEYYSNDTLNSECMVSTVSISESNKENKADVITNQTSAVTNCTQVKRLSKRNAGCRESSPTTATEPSSSTSTRSSEDDKLFSRSQEDINPYVIAGVITFICMVLLSVGMVTFLRIRRKKRNVKAFRKTQKTTEGQLICQKKCNPGIASSQSLL